MILDDALLDNPILIKHLRSRLRLGQMIAPVVVVMVLCICILWVGYYSEALESGQPMIFILGLQVVLLVFMGASQIGSSLGGARESGILDFHRVSPQRPIWLTLGFFLGAPVREYLLCAVTLPFAATAAVAASFGLLGLVLALVPFMLAAWIVHAATMLAALTAKKPKAGSQGVLALLVVFSVFGGVPSALFYVSSSLTGIESRTASFFEARLPWLVFVLLYAIPVLGFLLVACVRKMASERAHVYSKPLALSCMTTLTVLVLGALWGYAPLEYSVPGVLYGLLVASIVLSGTITPDSGEYLKGLRRAIHQGARRPSPLVDAGANRWAVFLLSAILFAGTTICWEKIEGRAAGGFSYSQTIAVGVLTSAYFGLALQYFLLRLPKGGRSFMFLFIFLAWVVPLVAGSIGAISSADDVEASRIILSVSPLAGIATSSNHFNTTSASHARIAALAPAVTFAFLFNFLLVAVQRKLDLAVRSTEKPAVNVIAP